MTIKRVILTLGVALAVMLLLASPRLLRVSETQAESPRIDMRFRGHVTPSRVVELMAPLEEVLLSVDVQEGDRVEAAAPLARLDDRLQSVAVEAARLRAESKADLQATALDLEEAEENLRLIESAFENGAASDNEARHARVAAGRADAAHLQALEKRALAEVSLQLEERRLERYRVLAPFAGTVIRVPAESGAMLTSEDTILVLADLTTLEAEFNLPAQLYGQLTVGGQYRMNAEAPVRTELLGTLQTVDRIIDTASQTFRCVFAVDNRETQLPAGFTVHLQWPQPQVAAETN